MMHRRIFVTTIMILYVLCAPMLSSQGAEVEPQAYAYSTVEGVELKAHVFRPDSTKHKEPHAAIVLFHGGGWSMGEAAWVFPRARRFAEQGMVAVAAQYRLSDQKTITPLEAMADARAVIRWMRTNAKMLRIDSGRIAAYGVSAGGHLAACAAVVDDEPRPAERAAPNALVLVSPAVHLEKDGHVQRLLGARADVKSISPVALVRKGMPPTVILQGDVDTVTPLAGARLFCDQMKAAGNRCELHVYEGFGHLFTPAGTRDDDWPKPDPKISADASRKADEFLISLGFIKPKGK
jgi:acetyl esterase/lipase